jgi:hypothetical protein
MKSYVEIISSTIIVFLRQRKYVFKIENTWLIDPEFHDYVRDRWGSYGDQAISQKLNMCARIGPLFLE